MAVSTIVKNFAAGSLILKDGAGTPASLSVDFDNGDFSLSGLTKDLREVAKYERRGSLQSVAYGARTYPTGSFTAMMTQFTDSSAGTLADFLLKTGAFSSNVSTQGTGSGLPYTVQLVFTVEGTDFGDSADHTFTLDDCRVSLDFYEGDPDSFSVSFEVLGAITGDLAAA